jgi:c-di-GMP-binding flagellar brake protein YcgR
MSLYFASPGASFRFGKILGAIMASPIERRRYERVPFFVDVVLRTAESGRLLQARTIDFSLGGVTLTTSAALVPGEDVTMIFAIPNAGSQETTEIVGRVVGFSADVDANRVGVEFLEPLSASRSPELVSRLLRN